MERPTAEINTLEGIASSFPDLYYASVAKYLDHLERECSRLKVKLEQGQTVQSGSSSDAPVGSPDLVNHPPHYARLDPQPIEVIEAWGLGMHLGNTLKYLARAGHKSGLSTIEDLKKARWYISRKIQRLETESEATG